MLSLHLTLPTVVNMLRNIAQGDPERIGRDDSDGGVGCTYASIKNGALVPVCIVGQMFANLGLLRLLLIDPSRLDHEGYTPSQHGACSIEGEMWASLAENGVTADRDAQTFMRAVQARQDEGQPWGEAYEASVNEYRAEQEAKVRDNLDRLFG